MVGWTRRNRSRSSGPSKPLTEEEKVAQEREDRIALGFALGIFVLLFALACARTWWRG